jgi:excisionase family DNA binding protein
MKGHKRGELLDSVNRRLSQRATRGVPNDADASSPGTRSTATSISGRQEGVSDGHADPKVLLRIAEAAHRLSLGRSTVYEMVAAGQLPVVRWGRAARIPASAIADWVQRQLAAEGES